MAAAYQAISPRSALLLMKLKWFTRRGKAARTPRAPRLRANMIPAFATQMFVYCSSNGKAEIPLHLPGLRIPSASLAGAVSGLFRVEHARPGSGRSVEH